MLQLKRKSGFTLIELLVVVIIVAVLAAVGIPLLSANVQRARASEAETGLGSIRTGLRAFFAENTTYVGATFPLIGINTNAGWANGDLDGRFFDDNDYTLAELNATTYCAQVVGGAGADDAPRHDDVDGPTPPAVIRSINELGRICQTACPCAGGG